MQRKNGQKQWVLTHLEVQGQPESSFTRRMYIYRYRIGDRYSKIVASLALLTDDKADWRPNQYNEELWGSKIHFEFPVVKLLDYATRWDELEASDNPFATVVMAHLKTLETKDDPQARWRWKFWLTRRLYERGYSRNDIANLFLFIDWIMQLPKELNYEFRQQVMQYEETKRMPYISTIERIAHDEGHKEGLQEGQKEGIQLGLMRQLVRVLQHRFATIDAQLSAQLQALSTEQLERLTDVALTIPSLDEFAAHVKSLYAALRIEDQSE